MNTITVSLAAGADWGNVASTAGIVTLVGMVAIFLVLALLWGTIEIMHRIIHKGEGEESKSTVQTAVGSPNPNDAAVAAAIAAAIAASEDEGATVAAITAAIIAARAEEGCTTPFRVVSFKRANSRRKI